MLQTKTQEQEPKEKPLNPFDYLPVTAECDSSEQEENEEVLRIVETLKYNRKKLYNK